MAKTAANLTDIINADALRALITEAAKSAAPEIKPISELVEFTNPATGETAQRAANVEALRDMARIYNASRADLPRNIYLYGGAGTGKSTLAADFADAINRPFYALTLGYDTTKSDILGYKTISGEYVSTPIIDAFECGGVLLLDELDACGGQALLYINNILSTRVGAAIETPRGKATRHPEFICIATGNTIGTGATNKFCGRSALDDSTRRRFAFLEVKTPRSLEISQTSAEFVEWLDGARERIKQSSTEHARRTAQELPQPRFPEPRSGVVHTRQSLVKPPVVNLPRNLFALAPNRDNLICLVRLRLVAEDCARQYGVVFQLPFKSFDFALADVSARRGFVASLFLVSQNRLRILAGSELYRLRPVGRGTRPVAQANAPVYAADNTRGNAVFQSRFAEGTRIFRD